MDLIDLHVHSTASDGTLSPSEVVILGKKSYLKAMALTDHDTTDGLEEAIRCSKEVGIELIPGIELSCAYSTKEIHIVGLFIDYKSDILKNKLNELVITRNERNRQICDSFKQFSMNIDIEDLYTTYPNSIITRAHFASYLVLKGYVHSAKEAFDRYLNDHGPCFVPRERMAAKETIELIHNAGGIAILAHPILYKMGNEQLEIMIKYLTRNGLDGIEAIYSTYTNSEEILIRKLAKENNLIISGGSDYHGANKPSIALGNGKGNLKIPYDIILQMKKKLCH